MYPSPVRLVIQPAKDRTKLLLTRGSCDLMRAVLAPPGVADPRAATVFLEGLSLWARQRLRVVLCADVQGYSPALGLCDGFGNGAETEFYEVEVIEPKRRSGLGSFHDLRRFSVGLPLEATGRGRR